MISTSAAAIPFEWVSATLFAVAILHTFMTKFFDHLAVTRPAHAGIWHLLGEVEVVFGFWALVLVLTMAVMLGGSQAITYVDSRNFTEPLFIFVIMVIAATKPVLQVSQAVITQLAKALPLPSGMSFYAVVMVFVPLLGSFITEPAAMTLAAMLLAKQVYSQSISTRLKYATIGALFVNVSIGGTLTSYAAPPVLMVAGAWGWDTAFMFTHFGWKAAIAVLVNTLLVMALCRKELLALRVNPANENASKVPTALVVTHLLFLAAMVVFAHHPAVFLGLFLFFLGIAHAYERHQDRLILREALLVAFFLAGLVVLGGQQAWWLKPLLMSLSPQEVYWGATVLTAFTDNAALTYLGSLVPNLTPEFQYALVAGAVTGGGLTVIANAPNPAGMAILQPYFADESVHPLGLAAAALVPTLVAAAAFLLL